MPSKLTPRRDRPAPVPVSMRPDLETVVESGWWVYVLRCGDGSLYCGITNDLAKRFARHQAGTGARYTRGRSPLVLMQSWPVANKSVALKAERRFKRFRKAGKETLLSDVAGRWLVV